MVLCLDLWNQIGYDFARTENRDGDLIIQVTIITLKLKEGFGYA